MYSSIDLNPWDKSKLEFYFIYKVIKYLNAVTYTNKKLLEYLKKVEKVGIDLEATITVDPETEKKYEAILFKCYNALLNDCGQYPIKVELSVSNEVSEWQRISRHGNVVPTRETTITKYFKEVSQSLHSPDQNVALREDHNWFPSVFSSFSEALYHSITRDNLLTVEKSELVIKQAIDIFYKKYASQLKSVA